MVVNIKEVILMAEKINKRNDPNYKQVIGYVHIDVVAKFRAKCIERNLNVSEAMEDALKVWNNTEMFSD
jgi:hypothetical protein